MNHEQVLIEQRISWLSWCRLRPDTKIYTSLPICMAFKAFVSSCLQKSRIPHSFQVSSSNDFVFALAVHECKYRSLATTSIDFNTRDGLRCLCSDANLNQTSIRCVTFRSPASRGQCQSLLQSADHRRARKDLQLSMVGAVTSRRRPANQRQYKIGSDNGKHKEQRRHTTPTRSVFAPSLNLI